MPNYKQLSEEITNQIKKDKENGIKSPYCFDNEKAIRRRMDHDKSTILRPAFARDTDKIMNVPYYARYADKTQVFSLMKNDDISRRSLHVQLVSKIARNIGRLLGLNIDLIEAISLGHDIGHTPFGHAGERILNRIYNGRTGRFFNHNIQSARVLDTIFPQNISLQTLDGVICHNGEMEMEKYEPQPYSEFEVFDKKLEECYTNNEANKKLVPATLEACVMRVSDIIAYLGKDRQDAEKLGLFSVAPTNFDSTIGTTNAEIINNMTVNIVENSYGKNYLKMDPEYFAAFSEFKKENGRLIYANDTLDKVYDEQIEPMMAEIYELLIKDYINGNKNSVIYTHHIDYIKSITGRYSYSKNYEESSADDIVTDYIASMTDDYFIDLYNYLFPKGKYKVEYRGYFKE